MQSCKLRFLNDGFRRRPFDEIKSTASNPTPLKYLSMAIALEWATSTDIT